MTSCLGRILGYQEEKGWASLLSVHECSHNPLPSSRWPLTFSLFSISHPNPLRFYTLFTRHVGVQCTVQSRKVLSCHKTNRSTAKCNAIQTPFETFTPLCHHHLFISFRVYLLSPVTWLPLFLLKKSKRSLVSPHSTFPWELFLSHSQMLLNVAECGA